MDILPPPKRPQPTPLTQQPSTRAPISKPAESSPAQKPAPLTPSKRPWYRKWQTWVIALLGLLVAAGIALGVWYTSSLQPVDAGNNEQVRIVVNSGESSSKIVNTLAQKGLVRSALATRIYIDINNKKQSLQAGGYVLTKQMDVKEIVEHISSGKTDELDITILPGLTLKNLADPEVKGSSAQQGFSQEEIQAAFDATYDSPLLADKPVGQGLEGYIFPETYRMSAGDTLSSIIQRSLDELYTKLQKDGLLEKFKARGLTIHQAVTLASIIQKEISDPAVQPQIAQVFYSRLAQNMVLGADATFEYAAEQLGVTPAVDVNSPYNTRITPGYPPGPIANMQYTALQAVADPAPGDYLYFVSGDDGKTYFARTFEEHEANIAAHCHELCNLY